MRPPVRPAGIILAILASLLLAVPAAAASRWTSFIQSGINAYADTLDCVENLDGTESCEGQSLYVFEGNVKMSGEPTRKGEQVCYNAFSYTYDPTTGEFFDEQSVAGCTLDAGTLTIDDLSSITLAPTDIELFAFECDEFECTETPAGSTTVYGTWTGVGPTVSLRGSFRYDDGNCVQVNSENSKYREATFQGSFDAQNVQINEGRFTFRTTCTFEEI